MSEPVTSKGIVQRLQTVPLFEDMPPDELSDLAALMTVRAVKAGENLVAEGEVGDEMFVLLRGQVRISKRTLDDEQYTVALRGEQDTPFFGELALLDQDKRSASIEATLDSELLVLDRDRFERFGNEHPAAGLRLMRQLAKRVSGNLRRANEDAVLLFEALVNEVRNKSTV